MMELLVAYSNFLHLLYNLTINDLCAKCVCYALFFFVLAPRLNYSFRQFKLFIKKTNSYENIF
jgi:hypothetical protein